MRSGVDAATLALYTSGDFDLHSRLKVANGSGTMIDLQGRYQAYDWKKPDPKEPIGSLSVDFIRETTQFGTSNSLAPMVQGSSLNKLDDGTTYSPLLQLGRAVTFEIALTAVGGARPADGATIWYEVFRGIIVGVDWPRWDSRRASMTCNGQAAILQHAKSESAYTYTSGTSIETVARQILDNNGFPSVPIHFPVATGKVLPNDYAPGLQKTVWSQLWALAQSMGWLVFYRYRGQNPVEVTFFEPARDKSVADMTVEVHDFNRIAVDEEELRNVGYLVYFELSGSQTMIGPFENASSITKYGGIRRPFWINLEEDSPIRTNSEASDMLTAALLDVSDPDVVAAALTFPLVFAEPGIDLYTFPAKERFFDSDQLLAPFGVTISASGNEIPVSVVTLRGLPTAGAKTWRNLWGPITGGEGDEDGLITVPTAVVDSLTLSELANNVLKIDVGLTNAASWKTYEKLGSWPTTNGLQSGNVDEQFIRVEASSDNRSVEHHAESGTWFVIAVPYDSSGIPGERKEASIVITASPPADEGTLSGIGIELVSGAPNYHEVTWQHNDAITNDPGRYLVTINRDGSNIEVDRDPRRDPSGSLPGTANSGGYRDTTIAAPCGGSGPDCVWRQYKYKMTLEDTDGIYADKIYEKVISGYYGTGLA